MSNREGNRSQHHFLFSFKVVALFSMSQLIQSRVINTLITYNLPESYTYLVPLCHVISCLINPELKGPYSYNWLRIPGSQALKAATLHFQTLFQNRSCHRKIGVEVMTTKDGICSHVQLSESADMKITEMNLLCPLTETYSCYLIIGLSDYVVQSHLPLYSSQYSQRITKHS